MLAYYTSMREMSTLDPDFAADRERGAREHRSRVRVVREVQQTAADGQQVEDAWPSEDDARHGCVCGVQENRR